MKTFASHSSVAAMSLGKNRLSALAHLLVDELVVAPKGRLGGDEPLRHPRAVPRGHVDGRGPRDGEVVREHRDVGAWVPLDAGVDVDDQREEVTRLELLEAGRVRCVIQSWGLVG